MGAQPGDCTDLATFTLPNHAAEGLTDQQCAERIADHFAAISAEFLPLDTALLPEKVKVRLSDISVPPNITERLVQDTLMAAKKPRSTVPGDLPRDIVKEFSLELVKPLHRLIEKIVQSAEWPHDWKIEYVTPLAKINEPEDEDDLRPISLTQLFSKVTEQLIVKWILEHIGDKIDFRQYGGIQGNSTSHYLIELINFVLHSQETPLTSVLVSLVDYSKAFNRQDHHILITRLSDMSVPPWLLKIVISYLTDRRMVVRYKGTESGVRKLPGGGPQGGPLGLLLFIVLVNDCGFEGQTNNAGDRITMKKKLKECNEIHLKYVDDLLVGEEVRMRNNLTVLPLSQRILPDTYHARTGHVLRPDNSAVAKQLAEIEQYAVENKMKLNQKKTKLMLFNNCKVMDFAPEFQINGKQLDVIAETKLLGITITSDLNWSSHVTNTIKACYKRLWIIKRLKIMGATDSQQLMKPAVVCAVLLTQY